MTPIVPVARQALSRWSSVASCIRHNSTLSTLRAAAQLLENQDVQPSHRVACYVRAVRKHQNVTFLSVTDGSSAAIQAVLPKELKEQFDHQLTPGVALEFVGRAKQSKAKQQSVELAIERLQITGACDSASYPIRLSERYDTTQAGQENNAERMRRYAHLRPRDVRHAAVLRARDSLDRALSQYFHTNDFVRVAAPILTSSDCEGGGEVFQVEAEAMAGKAEEGKETSFWSDSKAYLTVSAQLHLEALALGLGRVYTVGPSFRAEGSATNRHLAEFWMCEGEQITSQDCETALEEVTGVVEGAIKEAIRGVLTERSTLSQYLWQNAEEERQTLLSFSGSERWRRIAYWQAIEELRAADIAKSPPQWGASLTSEHERWLARDGPVFVTDYPAEQKPFYMRTNQDDRTVACFDLLVPGLGELVGGSLRETRADVLSHRLASRSTSPALTQKLSWYIDDLRRFGCNPHGGFGIGVERLLSWLTNTDSVRDVVTFPRVKGPLHF